MFAAGVAIAAQFTRPAVISSRRWDGQVGTGGGAYILLNDEGWIVTAAHTFNQLAKFEQDQPKVAALRAEIASVEADGSLKPGAKKTKLGKLQRSADREWLQNISHWWGADGVGLQDLSIFRQADIAVGRLDPYLPDPSAGYPVFKNPDTDFAPGASLCRLGFPFQRTTGRWDETRNAFVLENAQPVLFPIEGMYTRTIDGGKTTDGKHPLFSIETSSPGLLGQSGGPLFDVHGRVWGVQSRTQHIPLGFNPMATINGRETVVPQYINLGVATHSKTILSILDELGISHQVSPD